MIAPTPEPPSPPRRYAKLLERALLAEARAERAEASVRELLPGLDCYWEKHEGLEAVQRARETLAGSGRAALG